MLSTTTGIHILHRVIHTDVITRVRLGPGLHCSDTQATIRGSGVHCPWITPPLLWTNHKNVFPQVDLTGTRRQETAFPQVTEVN